MDRQHPIFLALTPFIQPDRVDDFSRYFQTFEGGYAEGDVFVGIMVPHRRLVARSNGFSWKEHTLATGLLHECHEVRHTALFALLRRFESEYDNRVFWHDFLVANFKGINNWDLVDTCAYSLLGRHAMETDDASLLIEFLGDDSVWKKRAAVVATLYFIANGHYEETLAYCPVAAVDAPEILQKAIGWALKKLWEKQPELVEQHLAAHFSEGLYTRRIVRTALEKSTREFRADFIASFAP